MQKNTGSQTDTISDEMYLFAHEC